MNGYDAFDGFNIDDEIEKIGYSLDNDSSYDISLVDDDYVSTALDKSNPGLLQKIRRNTLDPYGTDDAPIYYKLLEFLNLDELCRAYGLDTELFIENVQSGMSLDEAFNRGLAVADCSNIEEQREIQERKKQERVEKDKAIEKQRKLTHFLDARLRVFGRQCKSEDRRFVPNIAMIGNRRKIFVSSLANHICPSYSKDAGLIAIKEYNFQVSFSEFMNALASFLNDLMTSLEISVSNKELFRLFCKSMWANDMLYGDESIATLVSRADTEDLDSLMQERELETIQNAMMDPIYSYFMGNNIPTINNKHVFWAEELAGMLGFKDRIDYIDALLEDYSIEFLVRCQKQKMFVVQTIKGCDPEQIFMQGAAEVEYLYDVKIRSFYQYLMSNMPVSPDMQLDVTDAVKSLGIESKVDTLKCSACLWVHYNKFPCYDKDQIKMYARSYYAKKNGVK